MTLDLRISVRPHLFVLCAIWLQIAHLSLFSVHKTCRCTPVHHRVLSRRQSLYKRSVTAFLNHIACVPPSLSGLAVSRMTTGLLRCAINRLRGERGVGVTRAAAVQMQSCRKANKLRRACGALVERC